MNHLFWVGVYPGIKKEHLNFILKQIKAFIDSH